CSSDLVKSSVNVFSPLGKSSHLYKTESRNPPTFLRVTRARLIHRPGALASNAIQVRIRVDHKGMARALQQFQIVDRVAEGYVGRATDELAHGHCFLGTGRHLDEPVGSQSVFDMNAGGQY